MVVPTKTKNPASADATHILSNTTMTLLPMPSHGSNNNGRSLLRLPSGCRHKVPKFWVMKEATEAALLLFLGMKGYLLCLQICDHRHKPFDRVGAGRKRGSKNVRLSAWVDRVTLTLRRSLPVYLVGADE